jgi:hypothetical protein
MRTSKSWSPVGLGGNQTEIEHLRFEVTALNKRIEELERKARPGDAEVGALRASAHVLARQIDEVCCSRATDELSELLRK